jgi:hypothetical protein
MEKPDLPKQQIFAFCPTSFFAALDQFTLLHEAFEWAFFKIAVR